MKKFLFFALAAMTLAFTACEKGKNNEGPKDPDEIDVQDYVGSIWYLDSVNIGGVTTFNKCQPVFLLSENEIRIGIEVMSFRFDTTRVFVRQKAYDVVSLDDKGIVLSRDGATYYVSALPALDREEEETISESALIGKYKLLIGSMEKTMIDSTKILGLSNGGMIMWMTLQENHNASFEDTNNLNHLNHAYWTVKPEEKQIMIGYALSYDELLEENHWTNIEVFNDDYLVTSEDRDYDPELGYVKIHYETIWVRVEE